MGDKESVGTAREQKRRRRYWMIVGGIVAAAALIGFTVSVAGGALFDRGGSIDSGLAILLALALVLLMIVGSWLYFRNADELEWANNASAAFWGMNALSIVFPVWLILWKGSLAPEPDALTIFGITYLAAGIAYCWRRFV